MLVVDLLNMMDAFDDVIMTCFEGNKDLIECQKDAFTYFVNLRKGTVAELIAKFMDVKMKALNKSSNDDACFERLMNRVIMLFRFIDGKDTFELHYKRFLSRRLLCNRSASIDAEKAMLVKLCHECGPGFTSKLETMFKDIDASTLLMTQFRTVCFFLFFFLSYVLSLVSC